MLTISDLSKTYKNGIQALNNVNLEINNGMFGLLGPNGAGKSTLMRTIATLQMPDSGSILLHNDDILQNPQSIRSKLGYLPQEFGVYPRVSAYDLLDHIAVLKGITNKNERKEQINTLLEQTNLVRFRNKNVHTFSGGMKQRFGIAQALLGNPQIIIVDEPTAGLDPDERNRFHNLLSEIGENVIVLLSTHIVEDVSDLCPEMAILAEGQILVKGEPKRLIDKIKGRVWIKTISKNALDEYLEKYKVISTKLFSGQTRVIILSDDKPGNGFSVKEPDLEDVYFSFLPSLN